MTAQTAVDSWGCMCLQLAGRAAPALPDLPGRRHRPLTGSDDQTDETAQSWEAVHGPWQPPPEPPKYAWMIPPGATDGA